MTYDQAQSSRIRQRSGVENPGVRLIHTSDLPEVAYKGQLVYDIDTDFLRIYDGAAWQTIGDNNAAVTYVQASPPGGTINVGDFWLDTTTGYLQVWDGSSWVDPTALIVEDNAVGNSQLQNDSVDSNKLYANALTVKHTITGSIFRTSASGNMIRMRNDGFGGVIEGFSGDGSEVSPSIINPGFAVGRPTLQLRSGSSTATPGGTLLLYGDSGGTNRKAEINCNTEVSGEVTANAFITTAPGSTSGGDAARIGAGGRIQRDASSRRYKTNIQTLEIDVEKVLSLRAVTFEARDDPGRTRVGFIAEEAHELGLNEWVSLDEHGHAQGFDYPAWTAALQQIMQMQTIAIAELTERLEALEGRA